VTRFLHPSKIVYTFLGVRGQSKPSLVWPHSYVGQLFGPLGALGSAASADHVAVPNQIKIRHWTLDIGPTWWIFATRSHTSKIAWRIGYCEDEFIVRSHGISLSPILRWLSSRFFTTSDHQLSLEVERRILLTSPKPNVASLAGSRVLCLYRYEVRWSMTLGRVSIYVYLAVAICTTLLLIDHVAVPNTKSRLDIGPTWWIFATRSHTSKIAWRIGYCEDEFIVRSRGISL
jgi:hypothetical protein